MDKMIVVVFDSEKKAYEGSKALRELHDDGQYYTLRYGRDSEGRRREGDSQRGG